MNDSNPLPDLNGTPEDVATLYSWANLHGAKYRDFSAARALTREKARLRAEQAALEQGEQPHAQAEPGQVAVSDDGSEEVAAEVSAKQASAPPKGAQDAEVAAPAAGQAADEGEIALQPEAASQAEEAYQAKQEAESARRAEPAAAERAAQQIEEEKARMDAAEMARQQEQEIAELNRQRAEEVASQQAEGAARQAEELAASQAVELAAQQRATEQARQELEELAARQARQREAEQAAKRAAQMAQQRAWQQAAAGSAPQTSLHPAEANHRLAAVQKPAAVHPTHAPAREEASHYTWPAAETREPVSRPAWLSNDEPEEPAAPAYAPISPISYAQPPASLPQAPDDTLQGSRDRLTSRWFALRGVFEEVPSAPVPEVIPAPLTPRAPALAIFSLAGGVGKTSMVATLGRALSARGERVLLVDTAAFGLLPFFFGAIDQRPGLLRTFNPPGISSDAPIQMVTIDPDGLSVESGSQESLSGEIAKFARGASRIIIDLATASGSTTRRIMRMSPMVLVPVIPDMNSVVSVSSIDAFFEHNNPAGKTALPFYVLNQFDASLPLHLDVREVLREQLGDRLLPFALRRAPSMSEALAEGMTVMDYAPGSTLAEDFATLAGWVKNLSAPATTSYRGVRWSER